MRNSLVRFRAALLCTLLAAVFLSPTTVGSLQLAAGNENNICAEVYLDLNNDERDERLTLGRESDFYVFREDWGQYYTILIDSEAAGQWKRVFDSRDAGLKDLCGELFGDDKALFRCQDNNKNKIPELYFSEWSGPYPDRLLIIEYGVKGYEVLLRAELGLKKYRDLNDDGLNEICGIATLAQLGTIWQPSFWVAYTFNGTKYVSSFDMTRRLHRELLESAEKAFVVERTGENLRWLLGICAMGGWIERGREIIQENERLILDGRADPQDFREDLESVYRHFMPMWEKVRVGKWQIVR